jgi:hypothetical protein
MNQKHWKTMVFYGTFAPKISGMLHSFAARMLDELSKMKLRIMNVSLD